jgi:hypothetical protein
MPIQKNIEYVVDEMGCWIITSHISKKDKPAQVRINGKRYRAHRYLYMQKYGYISDNTPIYHKCTNHLCCNPDHLSLNIKDRYVSREGKDIEFNVQESGCWYHTGKACDSSGYPIIRRKNKVYKLSRYVYEQHKEKIPTGMVVRHKCDNPLCVNPEHLEIGTHADNVRDRVQRNRSAIGTNNGRAKLNEDLVRYIRNNDCLTNLEMSLIVGVDAAVIRSVKSFKTWKHVK